tara:strand:- start:241 stop:1242 length:1002 start_codon:yes stop_codon:yes gene_type:complete
MDFLGYDRAVSRGNMYSQNVINSNNLRQQQLRSEIGDISGNLATAESNIQKTKGEERIGTGIETGVDLARTAFDGYSLKNVLNEHIKKGQEFADKVSSAVGNQAVQNQPPPPEEQTNPQASDKPQSQPQSTPPQEEQPVGTQSSVEGTVETSESVGEDVGEKTAANAATQEGETAEQTGSRLAKYAGISEETAGKLTKGFGIAGNIAGGAYDVSQDLNGGFKKMDSLQKVGNIGDLTGDALDIVGAIPGLEPLELLGEGIKLLSGLFSSAGDVQKEKQEQKEEQQKVQAAKEAAAQQKAQAQQQLQQQSVSAPVRQGLIAAPVQTIQQRIAGQ